MKVELLRKQSSKKYTRIEESRDSRRQRTCTGLERYYIKYKDKEGK